jgi:hypothetical protein
MTEDQHKYRDDSMRMRGVYFGFLLAIPLYLILGAGAWALWAIWSRM